MECFLLFILEMGKMLILRVGESDFESAPKLRLTFKIAMISDRK